MGKHEGKVAVCFGAARGIGARAAERLAAGGAKVVIGDVNLAIAEQTAAGIRAGGGEAVALTCDISSEEQVAAVVAEAVGRFGGIDLVHQNAADASLVARDIDLIETDLSLFDQTIAVNLRGSVICTRLVVPEIIKRGAGAIVYTSTDGVYTQGKYQYFYRMSKAGLNSLMRSVAHRYGKEGVRANVVSPGMILADDGEHMMPEEIKQAYLDRTSSTRLGQPADVAAMVDFLLSDDAGWVTGQNISVNGGYMMRP